MLYNIITGNNEYLLRNGKVMTTRFPKRWNLIGRIWKLAMSLCLATVRLCWLAAGAGGLGRWNARLVM